MRIVRHPMVARDLRALATHIFDSTGGDLAAALRRLDEVEALIAAIAENPQTGARLAPAGSGWRVRHGGRGQRVTIVFHMDPDLDRLFIALVAFGPQDWPSRMQARRDVLP